MQLEVSLILVLGLTLEFHTGNTLSKLIYVAIIVTIAKCNYHIKGMLSHMYQSSQNKLKDFI